MSRRRADRRVALIAAGMSLLSLLPLVACSDASFQPEPVDLGCPTQPGGPVTLVVGARANSPAPVLPATVVALMREAAKQSQTISLIRIDGSPTVAFQGTFRTDARNDVARRSELDAFLRQTEERVGRLEAKQAEADVLAALNEAARITPEGGSVVVLDSGLQTAGQLRFQDDGTFGADPKEVVEYLRTRELLPRLASRSVVLVGLGNTAEPQAALDASLRGKVTAMWQTIVDEADASCVEVVDTAASRTSIDAEVPVTVVPVPTVAAFAPCGTTILRDGDTVGFIADQANFRDPAAARKTLQELASLVLKGQQLIDLIGTTSSAGTSEPGRVELSKRRAEAVRAVLIELGIPAGRIKASGVGSTWPDRVNDRAPDGSLIPTAAARNRSVVVRLSCPSLGP